MIPNLRLSKCSGIHRNDGFYMVLPSTEIWLWRQVSLASPSPLTPPQGHLAAFGSWHSSGVFWLVVYLPLWRVFVNEGYPLVNKHSHWKWFCGNSEFFPGENVMFNCYVELPEGTIPNWMEKSERFQTTKQFLFIDISWHGAERNLGDHCGLIQRKIVASNLGMF